MKMMYGWLTACPPMMAAVRDNTFCWTIPSRPSLRYGCVMHTHATWIARKSAPGWTQYLEISEMMLNFSSESRYKYINPDYARCQSDHPGSIAGHVYRRYLIYRDPQG